MEQNKIKAVRGVIFSRGKIYPSGYNLLKHDGSIVKIAPPVKKKIKVQ